MKKPIFLLAIAMFFSVMSYSQETEHFKFQGIPIDGSISSFKRLAETKGWTPLPENENILKGSFAGEDVVLGLYETITSNTVFQVGVIFEGSETWQSLKTSYSHYKELLTTKYGEPSNSVEYFTDPYYEGDGYELTASKTNHCTYMTTWTFDNGSINLIIVNASLCIAYIDSTNSRLDDLEKNRKAYEDL